MAWGRLFGSRKERPISNLKLYAAAAILLILVAGAATLYTKGRLDASHAAETKALKATIGTLNDTINKDRARMLQDSILAEAASKRQAELQARVTQLETYGDSIPDGPCFDAGDTDQLRHLWGH